MSDICFVFFFQINPQLRFFSTHCLDLNLQASGDGVDDSELGPMVDLFDKCYNDGGNVTFPSAVVFAGRKNPLNIC